MSTELEQGVELFDRFVRGDALIGSIPDPDASLEAMLGHFSQAADAGEAEAFRYLGECWLARLEPVGAFDGALPAPRDWPEGSAVIEDDEPILEAALRAFHVAGTLGDAEAIRRFARTSRHSTADNQRRGLALLETLEQPADLVLRGWVLSWLGELEASAAVQRRAAEAGDLDAAFELSILHGEGLGVDADAAEARRWLTKAADGGHPQALYNLAAAAATGADGERDLEEAAALYRRAAQGGYGRAAATLAVMMLAGEVEGSAKEACDWLDRADERGFASWRLLEAVGIDDPRAAP